MCLQFLPVFFSKRRHFVLFFLRCTMIINTVCYILIVNILVSYWAKKPICAVRTMFTWCWVGPIPFSRVPPNTPRASNCLISTTGLVDRQALIDQTFLFLCNNKLNASGFGSIKIPVHPNCLSSSNVFDKNSPSNAPASTKKFCFVVLAFVLHVVIDLSN